MSGEKSINTNQYCHKSIVTNCLNLIATPFMIEFPRSVSYAKDGEFQCIYDKK